MKDTTTLFFDIGGVILTDGWDNKMRSLACRQFDLDLPEFEKAHQLVADLFETGQMGLSDYLDRTVFQTSRAFSKADFVEFIRNQSVPNPDTLAVVKRLAGAGQYLMCTLNNESFELNCYRIAEFGLSKYFTAFFSSCFLGVKKPAPQIYVRALQITQRLPGECVFIDDRESNLEQPRLLGMKTIHFRDAGSLCDELSALAVEVPA